MIGGPKGPTLGSVGAQAQIGVRKKVEVNSMKLGLFMVFISDRLFYLGFRTKIPEVW